MSCGWKGLCVLVCDIYLFFLWTRVSLLQDNSFVTLHVVVVVQTEYRALWLKVFSFRLKTIWGNVSHSFTRSAFPLFAKKVFLSRDVCGCCLSLKAFMSLLQRMECLLEEQGEDIPWITVISVGMKGVTAVLAQESCQRKVQEVISRQERHFLHFLISCVYEFMSWQFSSACLVSLQDS